MGWMLEMNQNEMREKIEITVQSKQQLNRTNTYTRKGATTRLACNK